MSKQKRLIVCFDGTWNMQDSSTNVLQHFNLMTEGDVPGLHGDIEQKKYYHLGVGTGVLDRITGGGFGFGLEKNVRDGYNWLVANYCDGNEQQPPDEIFMFGFSRGAYTARSLVGFIAQCGLLRRGAPITVDQLWDDYCILGRRHEHRKSIWDDLFQKDPNPVRPITDLLRDPWLLPKGGGPVSAPRDDREVLMLEWSRRVKITYLGIYDTVGAIGWDALAIPGLTSGLALVNNMHPTTLIQHCRHALAMNENRSSFNHTPFLAFIGHGAGSGQLARGAPSHGPAQTEAEYWEKIREMWRYKIEQRWFVGAHSNIGGGYENNRLAEVPLGWILEGAAKAGLQSEPVHLDSCPTAQQQQPRDSFAEFAPPLWTKVLRAKRNYRLIDPDPAAKASLQASKPGFSLATIHENVDACVFEYWNRARLPMPPNLFEYMQRRKLPISAQRPKHSWLDSKLGELVALILWATVAAAGVAALYQVIDWGPDPLGRILAACGVALFLPFVDWGESAANFKQAEGRGGPGWRAFLDSVYWTRAFGFVLFLFGLVYSIRYLGAVGWDHGGRVLACFSVDYLAVPFCAAAAVLLPIESPMGIRRKPLRHSLSGRSP
jgi:uncharacterized protein (DUF2235 family)